MLGLAQGPSGREVGKGWERSLALLGWRWCFVGDSPGMLPAVPIYTALNWTLPSHRASHMEMPEVDSCFLLVLILSWSIPSQAWLSPLLLSPAAPGEGPCMQGAPPFRKHKLITQFM